MHPDFSTLPALELGTNVETGERLLLYGDGLRRHRTITGISGSGKSKLISSLCVQLLSLNLPVLCVGPHSDLCDDILSVLFLTGFFDNEQAYERLWYIRFVEPGKHVPFNWLKQPFSSQQIAANFLECCKRVWGSLDEGSSVTFENMVQAAVTVLCENRRPLTELPGRLTDTDYREGLLTNLSDPIVLEFFRTRFENYGKMALESTLRRIFLLSFSLPLRTSLGDPENVINFSRILDEGRSVLFDLGGLDEQTQRFLGVLLTVGFETAMLARATQASASRRPTQLILDEWFSFLSQSPESLQRMLDLTRKFGMTLTLASQSLAQGRDIRAALQTCLQIAFRLGHDDANSAAPRFTQTVVPPEDPPFLQDLVLSLLGVGQHPAEPDLKRTQASYWETRLKHLPKGHALVHIANQTVEVETLIAPPIADQRDLNRIKEEDILQAVLTYQYLSVPQLTRLFFSPHSKHSANHAGEYLKGLTEAGYLHRFPLPKTQRGTPAFIYTLSGKGRKHLASLGCDLPATTSGAKSAPSYQHTLSVNDVLIAASLLPRSVTEINLECLRHEWMLKQRPLHARPAAGTGTGKNAGTVIPDGYLDFRLRLPEATYQTAVWLELDRGTEEQKQFHMKVRGLYAAATTDSYLREYAGEAGYLTIAFATTAGDKRARQLRTWIKQELTSMKKTADADLLLTASLPCPAALTPSELFLSPIWQSSLADTAMLLLDLTHRQEVTLSSALVFSGFHRKLQQHRQQCRVVAK